MKFSTLALVASAQAGLFGSSSTDADAITMTPEESYKFRVAGFKGFHEGFNKSFYKTRTSGAECLNDSTVENMIELNNIIWHPMTSLKNVTDVKKDFNLFAEAAEVMENLSQCHFEGPAIELLNFCTKVEDACKMGTLFDNLSKGAILLIGKITSAAEVFKDMPAKDAASEREIMMQLGDDVGTLIRTLFNYHGSSTLNSLM